MLTTQQLCISAGQRRLVTSLNWQVKRGEFWCVLGKNGAGKTSLLHTLAGAATPAQGSILLSEQNIAVLDALILARLRGLLLQSYSDVFMNPYLTSSRLRVHRIDRAHSGIPRPILRQFVMLCSV
jgi:iron complex transport system ATP-binding protein